jgi:hypothetical protein
MPSSFKLLGICQPREGRRMKLCLTEAEVMVGQRSFATSRGCRRCGAPSKVRRICQPREGRRMKPRPTEAEVKAG